MKNAAQKKGSFFLPIRRTRPIHLGPKKIPPGPCGTTMFLSPCHSCLLVCFLVPFVDKLTHPLGVWELDVLLWKLFMIYLYTPTFGKWWCQQELMVAHHCYSWCMWWFDTLWATLTKLWPHSWLCKCCCWACFCNLIDFLSGSLHKDFRSSWFWTKFNLSNSLQHCLATWRGCDCSFWWL